MGDMDDKLTKDELKQLLEMIEEMTKVSKEAQEYLVSKYVKCDVFNKFVAHKATLLGVMVDAHVAHRKKLDEMRKKIKWENE